jgi:hypothetical protein
MVGGDENRGHIWQSSGLPTLLCSLLHPNESLTSYLDRKEGWHCVACIVGVVKLKIL